MDEIWVWGFVVAAAVIVVFVASAMLGIALAKFIEFIEERRGE
jgi:mannose/fructose/N-acetylgalactosamine-specific phosphotransferase system component IIC